LTLLTAVVIVFSGWSPEPRKAAYYPTRETKKKNTHTHTLTKNKKEKNFPQGGMGGEGGIIISFGKSRVPESSTSKLNDILCMSRPGERWHCCSLTPSVFSCAAGAAPSWARRTELFERERRLRNKWRASLCRFCCADHVPRQTLRHALPFFCQLKVRGRGRSIFIYYVHVAPHDTHSTDLIQLPQTARHFCPPSPAVEINP
jgi:hypothetical protein